MKINSIMRIIIENSKCSYLELAEHLGITKQALNGRLNQENASLNKLIPMLSFLNYEIAIKAGYNCYPVESCADVKAFFKNERYSWAELSRESGISPNYIGMTFNWGNPTVSFLLKLLTPIGGSLVVRHKLNHDEKFEVSEIGDYDDYKSEQLYNEAIKFLPIGDIQ